MMASQFQLLRNGKVRVQITEGTEGSESDTMRGHNLRIILIQDAFDTLKILN